MSTTVQDERFMSKALELARQGTALSSPGARVGAVVVDKRGEIAGTGFYTYDGLQHAEALALGRAEEKTRGGTLYVSLEPCSHHGRTPPCADLIIAAGVRRVVAAMGDPNPLVAGRGFAKLRHAGIEVEIGPLDRHARRMNENFARYILTRKPLVTLKSAMTLDGKIATTTNTTRGSHSSTFITGPEARAYVQELRHEADAIMVGVGTVLADDPLLTDRTGRPRRRPLLRLILDSGLRIPIESRLVQTAQDDLVVFYSRPNQKKEQALAAAGVRIEQVAPDADGRVDLVKVITRLGEMEITALLIEGGAQVNGTALKSGIVDKVFLYYAPTVLGGLQSVPFISAAELNHPVRIDDGTWHRFGQDVAIEGYLRDPYRPSAATEVAAEKVGERT